MAYQSQSRNSLFAQARGALHTHCTNSATGSALASRCIVLCVHSPKNKRTDVPDAAPPTPRPLHSPTRVLGFPRMPSSFCFAQGVRTNSSQRAIALHPTLDTFPRSTVGMPGRRKERAKRSGPGPGVRRSLGIHDIHTGSGAAYVLYSYAQSDDGGSEVATDGVNVGRPTLRSYTRARHLRPIDSHRQLSHNSRYFHTSRFAFDMA